MLFSICENPTTNFLADCVSLATVCTSAAAVVVDAVSAVVAELAHPATRLTSIARTNRTLRALLNMIFLPPIFGISSWDDLILGTGLLFYNPIIAKNLSQLFKTIRN
jgi:hypothetical protein